MDADTVFSSLQTAALSQAVESLVLTGKVVRIESYYPKSCAEIETQLFNLHGHLPQRLCNEEEIAMWFLEAEHLNRTKVFEYLGYVKAAPSLGNGFRLRREDIPKAVLRKIASKVCSLEVAQGFVEGLKLFIPVVGCWEALQEASTENVVSHRTSPALKRILTEYILAHMQYSDKPVFQAGSVTDSNVESVVQVAISVLSLSKILHDGVKSTSAAMAEFFATIRTVLREQQQPSQGEGTGAQQLVAQSPAAPVTTTLTMSMKTMTDLFTATSTGLPLGSLVHTTLRDVGGHVREGTVPPSPSYLFAHSLLSGAITLGSNLEEHFTVYFARLGHDALYLFEQPTDPSAESANSPGRLVSCIPLDCVHVRSEEVGPQSTLLTLVPLTGTGLPYITYSKASDPSQPADHQSEPQPLQCPIPETVIYPAQIYVKAQDALRWVDALEAACWECRANLMRRKQ
jgi:hypothetical protein